MCVSPNSKRNRLVGMATGCGSAIVDGGTAWLTRKKFPAGTYLQDHRNEVRFSPWILRLGIFDMIAFGV